MSSIKMIQAASFLILSLIMSGCDRTIDTAKYHRDAIEAIEAEQFEDSLIYLKMALKGEPSNSELRRLLGVVWFNLGDVDASLHQLDKAKSLGHNPNELVLAYARCYLYKKNYEKLQALDYEGKLYKVSSTNMAQLFSYKALGEMEQGHFNQALDLIDHAKMVQANHPLVMLTHAQWLAYQKEQEEALEILDELLEKSPKFSMAWGLKGDLLRLQGSSKQAVNAYSQAILYSHNKIDLLNYHTYRGLVHVYVEDVPSAKQDIQWLEKHFPQSHGYFYLQGLSALNQHEYKTSIEAFQKALQLNKSMVYAHYFLGLNYFLTDSFQKAREHLVRYTHVQPKNLLGHKLLALTDIKLNDYNNAKMRLSQLIALYPNDAHLYQMLGEVLIKEGDIDKGSQWLEKALQLAPDDVTNSFKFGMTQMDLGDVHSARWAFDKVLKKQPNSQQALLLKFMNEYKAQHFVLALDLAHHFLLQYPNEPIAHNLIGMVHRAQNKTQEARASFEQALTLDAHDPNAHTHLAYMAMKQKDSQTAKQHLEQILKRYEHGPTLLKYAKFALVYEQDTKKAHALLERAIQANPYELQAYLALTRLLMAQSSVEEALSLLQTSPKALKTHPDYLALEGLLFVKQKQLFTARKHWLSITKDQKTPYVSPLILEFGMTLAQQLNDWSEVLPFVERTQSRKPTAQGVRLHAMALQHQSRDEESIALLNAWLERHPHDAVTRLLQANVLVKLKQWDQAEQHYRMFLQAQPNHAIALNNLAWILRDKQPDEALSFAKKAVELKPEWSSAHHTLQTIQSLRENTDPDQKIG